MMLLEQIRAAGVTKRYSHKTVDNYAWWAERFVKFVRGRDGRWVHPKDLGAADVEAVLMDLTMRRWSATA